MLGATVTADYQVLQSASIYVGGDFQKIFKTRGDAHVRNTVTGASGIPSTYAGNVNINAGTLRLDNGITMGDLASINLANTSGATLNVTGNETIGSLSGGGPAGGNVTLSAITLTTGGNGSSTTFAGS